MTTAKYRRGVTLVEIMAAILVLSIGLVGVLAAIPFGGMRLAQMNEADNSASVGSNALRIMDANGWANPNHWWIWDGSLNGNAGGVLGDGGQIFEGASHSDIRFNLQFPYFVDPYNAKSFEGTNLYPYPFSRQYTGILPVPLQFTYVSPLINDVKSSSYTLPFLEKFYENAFYQQDDLISGVAENEDESEFRPQIETEPRLWPVPPSSLTDEQKPQVPSFSGRYTWMACVYPRTLYPTITNVPIDAITSSDYDVVVFKDRTLGASVLPAQLLNSGYQGGVVDVNLNNLNDVDVNLILSQLETTRCIMLAGQDDVQYSDGFKYYARWFTIANYGRIENETTGASYLRLTLVGPNMPTNWTTGGQVAAVFCPGAVGVYSGKSSFAENLD